MAIVVSGRVAIMTCQWQNGKRGFLVHRSWTKTQHGTAPNNLMDVNLQQDG